MVENKKIMAKNIKNQMLQNGVTAADVCKALNIKPNTFSDWVNAKTYPRIDQIQKLADYFDIHKFMLVEDMKTIKMHTESEDEIIQAYRNASGDIRQAARAVLGVRKECEKK